MNTPIFVWPLNFHHTNHNSMRCWRKEDNLISNTLRWTPTHGHTIVGRPGRTCINQLCVVTRSSLEELRGAMDDRDGWREKVKQLHAISTILAAKAVIDEQNRTGSRCSVQAINRHLYQDPNTSPTFLSLNPHFNPTLGLLTLCQVLSGGRQRHVTII